MQRGGQFKTFGTNIKLHDTPPFRTNEVSLTASSNKKNLINTYACSAFFEVFTNGLLHGGKGK